MPAQILHASTEDLSATKGQPTWQSDWESEYLNKPSVDKYALKLENGELIALGAYQVSGRVGTSIAKRRFVQSRIVLRKPQGCL